MTSTFYLLLSAGMTKKRAGMDTECHAGTMTTFANPLAPPPARITDGSHRRIMTANQLYSL